MFLQITKTEKRAKSPVLLTMLDIVKHLSFICELRWLRIVLYIVLYNQVTTVNFLLTLYRAQMLIPFTEASLVKGSGKFQEHTIKNSDELT